MAVAAVARLPARDESPVRRAIDALEIGRRGNAPDRSRWPNHLQLWFAQAAAQHGNGNFGTHRSRMKGAHEGVAGLPDQRIEDGRRLAVDDFGYDVIDRGIAELQQPFGEQAPARRGDELAQHAIGFPGPYIVRTGPE